jgi:polysaccharide biosynthesis transport protein
MIKLRELQRDVDVRRSVYEARLLRAGQTAEQVDLNTANISLIVPPRAAEEPTGPSRKLIILAGALAGFALGLALAVLKGVMDSLRGQADAARPARPAPQLSPTPDGGGGGGMFQPRPATSVSEEVRNTLNALRARTAPAMEQTPEPAAAAHPAPVQQHAQFTQAAVPAPPPAAASPPYAYPSQAQPNLPQQWPAHPAFQHQHFPHPPVQPGPMMYPYPAYAPQQPAFVPQQPVYMPQPPMAQVWQQPMPQMVQMPMPSQAPHPFAHEAAPPASQAPQPAASPQIFNIHQAAAAAPADPRLDDIQRSIEEFRSALTDFARRRSA